MLFLWLILFCNAIFLVLALILHSWFLSKNFSRSRLLIILISVSIIMWFFASLALSLKGLCGGAIPERTNYECYTYLSEDISSGDNGLMWVIVLIPTMLLFLFVETFFILIPSLVISFLVWKFLSLKRKRFNLWN